MVGKDNICTLGQYYTADCYGMDHSQS